MLNSTNAQDTDATLYNSHSSDSHLLWTLGSNPTFNATGTSSVAYLWCDVPGCRNLAPMKELVLQATMYT